MIITSKDLITSSDLTRREGLHKIHRDFIGSKEWTRQKNQLHTIANKSFYALQTKLVKSLLSLQGKEDVSHKEIYDLFLNFFKQSYFLGVKSSGAGLVRNTTSIQRVYGNPKIYETEAQWVKDAALIEKDFWGEFLAKNKDKKISAKSVQAYVLSLDSHYLAGRLYGSPKNSVVYWHMPDNHPKCDACEHMYFFSPMEKDAAVAIPRNGFCSCGLSCNCSIKIMPSTALVAKNYNLRTRNDIITTLNSLKG